MPNSFNSLVASVQDADLCAALREFHFRVQTLNLTKKSIAVYAERLGYFAHYLENRETSFKSVTTKLLKEYVLSLIERGLAGDSVNGQIRVLRTLFRHLSEEGIIDGNPAQKLQLVKTERKVKPIIKENEISRLLRIPDRTSFSGMRNYCMILVFYDTLIRLSELTGITLDDLDLNASIDLPPKF